MKFLNFKNSQSMDFSNIFTAFKLSEKMADSIGIIFLIPMNKV